MFIIGHLLIDHTTCVGATRKTSKIRLWWNLQHKSRTNIRLWIYVLLLLWGISIKKMSLRKVLKVGNRTVHPNFAISRILPIPHFHFTVQSVKNVLCSTSTSVFISMIYNKSNSRANPKIYPIRNVELT